ncbi:MAG: hypothetical protein JXO51_08455 [Candidatus Aminicenantes bacterium]|nr:hypothetical protein [Candidatus Aminicenantes bacterium]
MAKNEGGFFWGVLVGAALAAATGFLLLSRSFRSMPAAGVSAVARTQARGKPRATGAQAGKKPAPRRSAGKK